MGRLRLFEYFVMALVLGVIICFCIQLSYIKDTSIGEVLRGYLPSSAVVNGNGIYLSCGILGATVMPHSLFLGSGIVQPRLRQFDIDNGNVSSDSGTADDSDPSSLPKYRPSIHAIRACLAYSITELTTSLFTFALFVNSAILIVAGAALYPSTSDSGSLFSIHALLSSTLSPAAGTIFALALLLSGTSAGIVCTMAGQIVSEGMIQWTFRPWIRRLVTRLITVVPSVCIAAGVGKDGLDTALTVSQVILSVILPFVSAPLLYFTCRSQFMGVEEDVDPTHIDAYEVSLSATSRSRPRTIIPLTTTTSSTQPSNETTQERNNTTPDTETPTRLRVNMKNSLPVSILAVMIWLVIVVMNIALLVLVGLGKA
ncbi:putative transporter protein smf2 [Phaeomoniella chlamydospora]|uniref:Putative transporter protein smf2 n=1 Tax=Phaeomoniella chlamydospora TaxID=158046 RepID=A0A0G2G0F5_PHACM|nr:putative transporter protein smf2 [Phaeomoniella chlamydospora]